MELHNSAVTTWQECHRKWYILSHLGYKPYVEPAYFTLGRLVHQALDAYYYAGAELLTAFQRAAQQERQRISAEVTDFMLQQSAIAALDEQVELGAAMLRGYVAWQGAAVDSLSDFNLEWLDTEQDFAVELEGDVIVAGRFDGIVRRRDTGDLWLVEHKTASAGGWNGSGLRDLERNVRWDWQPKIYTWAATRVLGEPVLGVIYNGLLKANPYDPGLRLQSGKPSKNKAKRTTPEIYRTLIEQYAYEIDTDPGTLLPEFQEHLDYLAQQVDEAPFYVRWAEYITTYETFLAREYFVRTAKEMQQAAKTETPANVMPALSRFNCPRCPVKRACHDLNTDMAGWRDVLETTHYGA